MAKKHKKHEEHVDETWLIPYADMLTLLLALFIVLFAMSSVDAQKFKQMAVAFNKELNGGTGTEEFLSKVDPATEENLQEIPPVEEKKPSEEEEQKELDELKKLQEKVDKYIKENNLSISLKTTLTEKGLMITIMDNALFDSGKADVKPQANILAKEIAKVLVQASPREVMISGHTDDRPISTSQYRSNWELSAQRSLSFLQVMLQNTELKAERFSVIGYGEHRPVAENNTAEGKAKNRRVEVLILPLNN